MAESGEKGSNINDTTQDATSSKSEGPPSEGSPRSSLNAEEDKRILRKVDMCLLPIMAVSYMFQFLDKSALSFTAIMGLTKELRLVGQEYSWSSSVYYFGYLVASYPFAHLMVRLPVGKVIAASVLAWGAVLMFTALCTNASGLMANRIFLGISEAAVAPGLSLVISMWYKRSEQPLRQGAWFLGNTFGGIIGGLVAYGLGHVTTISPWKAVFLVFGAFTVAWSAALFYLLPDTPMKAWFLSADDRAKAVERVRENMTGIKNDEFKMYQCVEALLDPQAWFLVLIQIINNIANGGLLTFSSIVVKGMGFSTLNAILVQIISYVFQGIFVIIATWGSATFPNTRTYFMAWNMLISIAGAAMVRQISADQIWARFFGACLTLGFTANFPMVLSVASGNFGGFTKKATVNAMIFIAYCAGNIVGPQVFFEREAPSYFSGFLAVMICTSIGVVICLALRFYLIWENRRRDRAAEATEVVVQPHMDDSLGTADKTDKEMKDFRYVY